MHKRNFNLASGKCLNDDSYGVLAFDVRVDGDDLLLLLPERDELDTVIGTSKWMVRQATQHVLSETPDATVEIVGPSETLASEDKICDGAACSGPHFDW